MNVAESIRRAWRGMWTRDGPTDKPQKVGFVLSENWRDLGILGYTSLDQSPEVLTAARKIASVIGGATIHLMKNQAGGDVRIRDGLARLVDIEPTKNMTRPAWMESIILNLLLYGNGNSVILPHSGDGIIHELEPISPWRVVFLPTANSCTDYQVQIDGQRFAPDEVLHFTQNPDPLYLWRGRGVTVSLREIADNLRQASATERAFLRSEYKPSIIVKVDAMIDEFSGPAGRQKIIDEYLHPAEQGAPWLIPAEQFQVEQVKPLTLADLAIDKTVELDRRAVASILGVPPFVLGVGEYKAQEWNYFIQTTVMSLCKSIAAEMTRKLLIAPDRYFRFNVWSLLDFDVQKVSAVLLAGSDRGFVTGDEWRDRMNLPPAGLKEFRPLENYIPYEDAGNQKKLNGGGTE